MSGPPQFLKLFRKINALAGIAQFPGSLLRRTASNARNKVAAATFPIGVARIVMMRRGVVIPLQLFGGA